MTNLKIVIGDPSTLSDIICATFECDMP